MFPSNDREYDNYLDSLLRSSLVFGDDLGANLIAWDLRTYSQNDESYDIHWIANDLGDDDNIYKVGRDFFEFIRDFCLGMKSNEILSEFRNSAGATPPEVFIRYQRCDFEKGIPRK